MLPPVKLCRKNDRHLYDNIFRASGESRTRAARRIRRFFRWIYVFNVDGERIYQKIIGKFQTLFVNDVFDIMSFYKFFI